MNQKNQTKLAEDHKIETKCNYKWRTFRVAESSALAASVVLACRSAVRSGTLRAVQSDQSSSPEFEIPTKLNGDTSSMFDPNLIKYSKRVFEIQNLAGPNF